MGFANQSNTPTGSVGILSLQQTVRVYSADCKVYTVMESHLSLSVPNRSGPKASVGGQRGSYCLRSIYQRLYYPVAVWWQAAYRK